MKLTHVIWLGLLCAGCDSQATTTPQEKPRTLALFALLEDGHKVTEKTTFKGPVEIEFAVQGHFCCASRPISVAPSTVVIVSYGDGGSESPPEMAPQVIPLKLGEEQLIHYQVSPKMKDGRLYIAILPQGSQEEKEVTALVEDWQKFPQSGASKVVQDRLSDWMEHQDQDLKHVGQVPANVGGVRLVSAQTANPAAKANLLEDKRQLDQPGPPQAPAKKRKQSQRWQEVADSVGTSPGHPGVFSYPIRFPKR